MTRKHSFNEVNYHVTPQYGRCLLKLDTIHATDRPLDSSLVLNTEEAADDVIRQRGDRYCCATRRMSLVFLLCFGWAQSYTLGRPLGHDIL